MQLKTITSQLGYLILTATFFIFYPSDNVYALGNQDQGSLVKADPPVGRLKKIRRSREGPILGFGIGVGRISFTEPLAEYWNTIEEARSKATGQSPLPREPRSALATELKIGHGLSDQFLFYYTSRILWAPTAAPLPGHHDCQRRSGNGNHVFSFPKERHLPRRFYRTRSARNLGPRPFHWKTPDRQGLRSQAVSDMNSLLT